MVTKQINFKNRSYYFWNDQIWINNFDAKNLKFNSVNPLYLFISELDGFIDEKNGNKYLNITLTDSNNDVLIKYAEVWNGIKNQIKKINNDSVVEYDKDYMKIKFHSDDNLPLDKVLKFHAVIIIIRSVFERDGKYYPQIFLDDALVNI